VQFAPVTIVVSTIPRPVEEEMETYSGQDSFPCIRRLNTSLEQRHLPRNDLSQLLEMMASKLLLLEDDIVPSIPCRL
jgi:hypothetical protein